MLSSVWVESSLEQNNDGLHPRYWNKFQTFALGDLGPHVSLICSQMFDNLVLCCGKTDGEVVDDGHYYLYDCYPPQFIDDERVQANRKLRAPQWETFLNYLESKGKLKK